MTLKELLDIAEEHLLPLTTVSEADFRLEQAEYNKKELVWDIVVSFLVENTNRKIPSLATLAPGFQYHRIYKKVKIDSEGEFKGFYIFNNKE